MSNSARRRSLRHIEWLEPKQMMAGDVAVSVVDGNLLVQGDDLGNAIAITGGDVNGDGSYVIRGLDGTSVHLASSTDPAGSVVSVSGVRRDVTIRMGAGDDLVRIEDAAFRGNVSIGTDGGSDRVVLGISPMAPTDPETAASDATTEPVLPVEGVKIGGTLRIATGEDGDRIHVANTSVRGGLMVFAGGGDDEVVLGLLEPSTPAATPLAVNDAEGPTASVQVGKGIAVHLGEGNDALTLHGARAHRGVLVDGGAGDDRMGLRDLNAGMALTVLGGHGEGADSVNLGNVRAHHAFIQTGAGNDQVTIVDSTFRMLAVALGDGDDSLAIGGVTAGLAVFQGGAGEDLLVHLAENMIARRVVRNFETLPTNASPARAR